MLWAAFCLDFLGVMRSGNFTYPSLQAFTSDMLSSQDVAVDSHTSLSHLVVHLRRSKNDPFGAGTRLHLGATGHSLCPVSSTMGYLAIRPSDEPGPLFLFRDGTTLSRTKLIQCLRQALSSVGVDCSGYNGHSFPTTAARMGVSDSLIKTLGHWRSSAFMVYIRTPWQQLSSVSSVLVERDS